MNIRENIARATKLPENNGEVDGVKVKKTDNNKQNRIVKPAPPQNSHLMRFDTDLPASTVRQPFEPLELDTGHILSCLAESCGRKQTTDHDVAEMFRRNQEAGSMQKSTANIIIKCNKPEEIKPNSTELNAKLPNEKSKLQPKRIPRTSDFPKNALMRSLVRNKAWISSLNTSSPDSPDSDVLSSVESKAEFMEKVDEPDVLYRAGMINKGIIEGKPVDDGFRFEHRGVKTTVTPRQYAINHVSDDSFVFKKNSKS